MDLLHTYGKTLCVFLNFAYFLKKKITPGTMDLIISKLKCINDLALGNDSIQNKLM